MTGLDIIEPVIPSYAGDQLPAALPEPELLPERGETDSALAGLAERVGAILKAEGGCRSTTADRLDSFNRTVIRHLLHPAAVDANGHGRAGR